MQTTILDKLLSGSTNGRPILVAANASPGTLIHTAVAGTDKKDKVWLYVHNNDTEERLLTLEWGGTATGDQIKLKIPAQGSRPVEIPGYPLNNGLSIRAVGDAANVLVIEGFAQEIEQG